MYKALYNHNIEISKADGHTEKAEDENATIAFLLILVLAQKIT